MFTYQDCLDLVGNKLGKHDLACPECGPNCTGKANQVREVLRVWLKEDFASFNCARCGNSGHTFADADQPKSKIKLPKLKPESADDRTPERQREKAQWLWQNRKPISGSVADTYLKFRGVKSSVLGFLPARKPDHHPAMIAPFGMASEPEPGAIRVSEVHGVLLTLLANDGNGKAGTGRDKIMIGPSNGWPIVLAHPNDGLALGIAEGIETALSLHIETGIGVWAAGSAGRLPAIADKIARIVETVTIAVEGDPAGQRGACQLSERLHERGIEVRMTDA